MRERKQLPESKKFGADWYLVVNMYYIELLSLFYFYGWKILSFQVVWNIQQQRDSIPCAFWARALQGKRLLLRCSLSFVVSTKMAVASTQSDFTKKRSRVQIIFYKNLLEESIKSKPSIPSVVLETVTWSLIWTYNSGVQWKVRIFRLHNDSTCVNRNYRALLPLFERLVEGRNLCQLIVWSYDNTMERNSEGLSLMSQVLMI